MPVRRPSRPRTARNATAAGAGALLATAAIAACGSAKSGSGASSRPQAPQTGAEIFQSAGCSGCHTLAAARSHGLVGPNLDDLKPSARAVLTQVTHGGGGMPAFSDQLSARQIELVARYVYTATHGS